MALDDFDLVAKVVTCGLCNDGTVNSVGIRVVANQVGISEIINRARLVALDVVVSLEWFAGVWILCSAVRWGHRDYCICLSKKLHVDRTLVLR